MNYILIKKIKSLIPELIWNSNFIGKNKMTNAIKKLILNRNIQIEHKWVDIGCA